jgi:AraC family transcriptional regulator
MDSILLKSRGLDGLFFAERHYEPEAFMPRHNHELARISFVLAGGYKEKIAGNSRLCRKSMLLLHPPGEAHEVSFQRYPVRIFSVEIDETWLKKNLCSQRFFEAQQEFESDYACHLSSKLYAEFNMNDQASVLAMEGLALEVLAQFVRRKSNLVEKTKPVWLERVREILNEGFREELKFKEIARLIDVHPVYLMREFRRFYGCTMGQYVRKLRIEFVAASITRSAAPISQIAIEAGFYDQAHCTNVFKKMVGKSPGEYRKKGK